MAERKRAELLGPAREEWTATDHEPAYSHFGHLSKNSIQVAFAAGVEDVKLQPKIAGCRQHIPRLGLGGSGLTWIDEQRNTGRHREQPWSICSRFGATSWDNWVTPVI